MEDWAEIRRLARAEGLSVKAIVRRTGISRNAVRRALASQGPPKYSRPGRGSVFDTVEAQVCALLRTDPRMPATVIAERVGWTHSVRLLRMRVRELRPLFLPADPVSRTTYDPGGLAQCDLWFPPVDLPEGAGQVGRPPVLAMVSGYSIWIEAALLPSRQIVALVLALRPVLDVLDATVASLPAATQLTEESVEQVAVELAQRQPAEGWTQVYPDDALVPSARGRLDVERLEVAVKQLVDRGAGLGLPLLVDLVQQSRPNPFGLGRGAWPCRHHRIEVVAAAGDGAVPVVQLYA